MKETLADLSSQAGQQEKPCRPVPKPHMVESQPAPEEQAVEVEIEEDAPAEPGLSTSTALVNIPASGTAAVLLPSVEPTPAPRYTLRMRKGR